MRLLRHLSLGFYASRQGGETIRQAAERTAQQVLLKTATWKGQRDDVAQLHFVGNCPAGWYWRTGDDEQQVQSGSFGDKVRRIPFRTTDIYIEIEDRKNTKENRRQRRCPTRKSVHFLKARITCGFDGLHAGAPWSRPSSGQATIGGHYVLHDFPAVKSSEPTHGPTVAGGCFLK